MGHNSFCGSHSEVGAEQTGSANASSSSAESHKVTIEVRDQRSREVQIDRETPLQASIFSPVLDAFSFLMIALFARHEVISSGFAAFLVGGVIGARVAECRLRIRARAAAAVTVVLLGLWGVLSLCTRS